ncbi:glycosyltransferase family 4 protein [bacterium]|nr:glycosyltransferase family 4 protein [bacterium]
MKKKILAYCDSPSVATGFGTVSRNVLAQLYKSGKYDIDIFGINYHGEPHSFPYRIWPAMDYQAGDPYGRKRYCHFAAQHDFDIMWVLQDTFIVDFLPELTSYLKNNRTTPFRTIMYYPIDSILQEEWYKNIKPINRLVAYTDFGKQAYLKHDDTRSIDVIYHGVDTAMFKPLSKEEASKFRKHYFGNNSDKFIFMNINRNQQRKDIPRTIQAFKEFQRFVPESILYLHMAHVDQGWNIPSLLEQMNLVLGKDVLLPEKMEPNQGYPVDIINYLYNACDCVLSTTLGEGMGLSWIEAMATKTPVIMPNNTAMAELITDDTGYLVNSGSDLSLWTCLPNDNDVLRPLVAVEDLVAKMLEVYNNQTLAKEKAEAAYKWACTNMLWSGKIATQWLKVFNEESLLLNTTTYAAADEVIHSEVF